MTIKTIFFDIDGTIYDENMQVAASTREAITELKRLGHNVAIATGRAPYMFENLRKEFEIDSYVSLNGQCVVYKGKTIYRNPIAMDSLKSLTLFAEKHDHPIAYMDPNGMKVNVASHVDIETSIGSLKLALPQHDPEYFLNHDIYQAMIFCPVDRVEAMYVNEYPELNFIRWHPVCMDVLPGNGSKANGIAQMMNILGVKKSDVYAFGDGLNDIEMLGFVGHGIAMGNARDEVKAAATYVTRNVDDNGIIEGLRMVGLL
ncbi:Cof-type HAD-IIB family hydrolase [Paenibacillus wynnii]|uniref:Phosphatase n=1 Tax=Paenibacillus wynnii TaxID=268407 RepID=A0A098M2P5_9BACL|nr:Cof-type HAD-IIB family hydrolase [Paenibacillus wynnii]KGE16253.1 phosphatase [Paenibacillus wynnii]